MQEKLSKLGDELRVVIFLKFWTCPVPLKLGAQEY